jgi:hypothetical protein
VAFLFVGDAAALDVTLRDAALAGGGTAPYPVASQSRGGYLEAGYDLLRLLAPGSEQIRVTVFRSAIAAAAFRARRILSSA